MKYMKHITLLSVLVYAFSLKAMDSGDKEFEKKIKSSHEAYLERCRCIDGLVALSGPLSQLSRNHPDSLGSVHQII